MSKSKTNSAQILAVIRQFPFLENYISCLRGFIGSLSIKRVDADLMECRANCELEDIGTSYYNQMKTEPKPRQTYLLLSAGGETLRDMASLKRYLYHTRPASQLAKLFGYKDDVLVQEVIDAPEFLGCTIGSCLFLFPELAGTHFILEFQEELKKGRTVDITLHRAPRAISIIDFVGQMQRAADDKVMFELEMMDKIDQVPL